MNSRLLATFVPSTGLGWKEKRSLFECKDYVAIVSLVIDTVSIPSLPCWLLTFGCSLLVHLTMNLVYMACQPLMKGSKDLGACGFRGTDCALFLNAFRYLIIRGL